MSTWQTHLGIDQLKQSALLLKVANKKDYLCLQNRDRGAFKLQNLSTQVLCLLHITLPCLLLGKCSLCGCNIGIRVQTHHYKMLKYGHWFLLLLLSLLHKQNLHHQIHTSTLEVTWAPYATTYLFATCTQTRQKITCFYSSFDEFLRQVKGS